MRTLSLICFSLLLLVSAGSVSAEEQNGNVSSLPDVAVHVQTLETTTSQTQVELVATIQPVLQARIAAKVSGTITDIPVTLGSQVKKGDLLVTLNAQEISARLMQAQAQLAHARRNYEREKKLLKKNATTRETVKSMQDMLTIARATFREAQTMLDYTRIRSPFSGVITKKMANSGDLATPGTPLLQLENNTRLQAVTAVPESLLRHTTLGDSLKISIPSAHLFPTGTIAEIAPSADPKSRTATVKIDIPYTEALHSGQFARVFLPVQPATTLMIPQSAVIPFGHMDRVFVLQDGKARLRLVRTGRVADNSIEILAGLRPGETIITDNNTLLVNGQQVSVQ